MPAKWKIVARHKHWAAGCTITELQNGERGTDETGIGRLYCRFSACVLDWNTFKLYEGLYFPGIAETIREEVLSIRDRIEAGDETIFKEYDRYTNDLAKKAVKA